MQSILLTIAIIITVAIIITSVAMIILGIICAWRVIIDTLSNIFG